MKRILCTLLCSLHLSCHAVELNGTVFDVAGSEYNIDPKLLYSIAVIESAVDADTSRKTVKPYPWTLRTDKPFYGKSREDAEQELKRLLKKGKSVDVGLMQINTKWHGHRVANPVDLLDPLTNVRIGAQILNERLSALPKDAVKAIGNYHSFDPERAEWYSRYVMRVWSSIH